MGDGVESRRKVDCRRGVRAPPRKRSHALPPSQVGTWETLLGPASIDSTIVGDWTPDGRDLLLSLRDTATGRRTVGRLALDSTPPKVSVIVDSGKDRIAQLPSISPDGRWLAYESNELGRSEVYVQSYPSPTTRVQVSRDGGARPMWARTGDALYFVAGSTLMISTHHDAAGTARRCPARDPERPALVVQAGPLDRSRSRSRPTAASSPSRKTTASAPITSSSCRTGAGRPRAFRRAGAAPSLRSARKGRRRLRSPGNGARRSPRLGKQL